jgi:integrase
LFGKEYQESDYIFKWDNGVPFRPDFVTSKFGDLLKKYDLPHIRFHDLRHSCASLLIAQGFGLKDVQEWLGHADITLTANIYSHLDTKRKQSIADSLASVVTA